MSNGSFTAAATVGLFMLLAQGAVVKAAEVRVIAGSGLSPVLGELGPQFERETGHKLVIQYGVIGSMKQQIESGEAFDLAILSAGLMNDMTKQGKIVAATRAEIARTGMAVGARAGASKPDISSADAFKRVLLNANSVAYAPEGASGIHLAKVFDQLGITGVLARELRLRIGPTGYVAGLDPSVGMLAVAKELSPSVDWRQGTAESMPFPDASFDAVVSQFGLMFMDRDRAIHEMLRVLKPSGRLVVAVWDTVQNIPAYAAEIALLERLAGTRAADALRAPFVLGDRELLAEVFNAAGASSVTISTPKGAARFPSIRVMVGGRFEGLAPRSWE